MKEEGSHVYRRSSHVNNLQKIGLVHLLKATSFQQFQIAQTKDHTPT
jgi:hypothetical protein